MVISSNVILESGQSFLVSGRYLIEKFKNRFFPSFLLPSSTLRLLCCSCFRLPKVTVPQQTPHSFYLNISVTTCPSYKSSCSILSYLKKKKSSLPLFSPFYTKILEVVVLSHHSQLLSSHQFPKQISALSSYLQSSPQEHQGHISSPFLLEKNTNQNKKTHPKTRNKTKQKTEQIPPFS